ncbi:hypothetical protein [Fusobacterium sp. PH5-44]|uniref:hypothetical protein n=1 Tax=unclassified Fusobacterium TaxID=2648384 RepID=UPI003D221D77
MDGQSAFITAKEFSQIANISLSTAYRMIREENRKLKEAGKIIIPGKISRKYFMEKTNI